MDKIISQIGKYHFLITQKDKVKLLSSGNNLNEVKSQIDKCSLKNKTIVFIKLKNVGKGKLFGGPIQLKIKMTTVDKDGDIILKKDDDRNAVAYFTPEYLKNKKINIIDIKKIALKAIKRKLKTQFMALNLIN